MSGTVQGKAPNPFYLGLDDYKKQQEALGSKSRTEIRVVNKKGQYSLKVVNFSAWRIVRFFQEHNFFWSREKYETAQFSAKVVNFLTLKEFKGIKIELPGLDDKVQEAAIKCFEWIKTLHDADKTFAKIYEMRFHFNVTDHSCLTIFRKRFEDTIKEAGRNTHPVTPLAVQQKNAPVVSVQYDGNEIFQKDRYIIQREKALKYQEDLVNPPKMSGFRFLFHNLFLKKTVAPENKIPKFNHIFDGIYPHINAIREELLPLLGFGDRFEVHYTRNDVTVDIRSTGFTQVTYNHELTFKERRKKAGEVSHTVFRLPIRFTQYFDKDQKLLPEKTKIAFVDPYLNDSVLTNEEQHRVHSVLGVCATPTEEDSHIRKVLNTDLSEARSDLEAVGRLLKKVTDMIISGESAWPNLIKPGMLYKAKFIASRGYEMWTLKEELTAPIKKLKPQFDNFINILFGDVDIDALPPEQFIAMVTNKINLERCKLYNEMDALGLATVLLLIKLDSIFKKADIEPVDLSNKKAFLASIGKIDKGLERIDIKSIMTLAKAFN